MEVSTLAPTAATSVGVRSGAEMKPKTQAASDIYDRQIRLWGSDSQSRISSAKVLFINITGTSSEILKNLVLAGVQPAICDGRSYRDICRAMVSSFPFPSGSSSSTVQPIQETEGEDSLPTRPTKIPKYDTVARAMQPLVHELNPLLDLCVVDDRKVQDIPDGDLAKYDVVIASRIPLREAIRISKASNKFYLADCFGLDGCAILDLGPDHQFQKEIGKDTLSDPMVQSQYVPFETIIGLPLDKIQKSRWDKIPPRAFVTYKAYLDFEAQTGQWPSSENSDAFVGFVKQWIKRNGVVDEAEELLGDEDKVRMIASRACAEVSPVCSVLGGIIGNEVIKGLSGKGEPANNVLLLQGEDGECRSFFVDSA